jgi:hypothetical protein
MKCWGIEAQATWRRTLMIVAGTGGQQQSDFFKAVLNFTTKQKNTGMCRCFFSGIMLGQK